MGLYSFSKLVLHFHRALPGRQKHRPTDIVDETEAAGEVAGRRS
jgi:hypothetical protein